MGRAPAGPLRCPANPRHASFAGSQRACFDSAVDLDANGAVLRRVVRSKLYDVSEPRDAEIQCAICGARLWRPWIPISFVPSEGTMLLCDFSTGFQPPEMVKMRPVVVLSECTRNIQTCIVVPVSSVPPTRSKALVVELDQSRYGFLNCKSYAKCEMITTVSRRRLFLFRERITGRSLGSRRTTIDANLLASLRRGAARALGLRLTL